MSKKDEENGDTKNRSSTSVLKKYGTNRDATSGSSGNLTALSSKYGTGHGTSSASGISTRRNSLAETKGNSNTYPNNTIAN